MILDVVPHINHSVQEKSYSGDIMAFSDRIQLMTETTTQELPHCSLSRRLAAIFYDALLLVAVLVAASFPPVLLFTSGENTPAAWTPLFRIYLITVSFLFFGWFWTHGGQTLGMRVWRIRVQTRKGYGITWWQAMLRFVVAIASWACIGLGFIWSLFDKEKMTWHDRYSESVLVVLPKTKK